MPGPGVGNGLLAPRSVVWLQFLTHTKVRSTVPLGRPSGTRSDRFSDRSRFSGCLYKAQHQTQVLKSFLLGLASEASTRHEAKRNEANVAREPISASVRHELNETGEMECHRLVKAGGSKWQCSSSASEILRPRRSTATRSATCVCWGDNWRRPGTSREARHWAQQRRSSIVPMSATRVDSNELREESPSFTVGRFEAETGVERTLATADLVSQVQCERQLESSCSKEVWWG